MRFRTTHTRLLSLLSACLLALLLFPLGWVSLGASNHSGSWLRQTLGQAAQDAPVRLIPLEELDTLPLTRADSDPLRRDPRRWRTHPDENNLRQPEIFPGVDLVFAGNKQKLEAVLIVKAGADLAAIHFDFPQAEAVAADAQGTIWVASSSGDWGLLRPCLLRQNQTVKGGFVAEGSRVALRV